MSDTQTGPTEVLVLSDDDDDNPSPVFRKHALRHLLTESICMQVST
jgi:hypothetical protein